MRIDLDFAPGLHGHFLELVINKYIYGIPFGGQTIFQSSGAAHPINLDQDYQKSKIVHRGHFSSFNYAFSKNTEKIIFVKHEPLLDFVLLTNIYYRCHPTAIDSLDFNVDDITAFHRSFLFAGSDLELRNNWFAKLNERHFDHTLMTPNTNLPIYNFDYKCFFNFWDFCQELKNTSRFLNETFKFDQSLCLLWDEFISRNQGWQLYNLGTNLVDAALRGHDLPIPDNWKLHAFINFKLSTIFDLYDGKLFEQDKYPATTLELLSIITQHVKNFDNRW
jgi:hypothetical protein